MSLVLLFNDYNPTSAVSWSSSYSDAPSALSNGNLTITGFGTTGLWHITLAAASYTRGKYYLETTVAANSTSTDGAWSIGVTDASLRALSTYLGAAR